MTVTKLDLPLSSQSASPSLSYLANLLSVCKPQLHPSSQGQNSTTKCMQTVFIAQIKELSSIVSEYREKSIICKVIL